MMPTWPRPIRRSIRLRTLMIAVAIAGLSLAAFRTLQERRFRFERLAKVYRLSSILLPVAGNAYIPIDYDMEGWRILDRNQFDKESDHYFGLYEKYQYASERPWLPVLPDPPAPAKGRRGERVPAFLPGTEGFKLGVGFVTHDPAAYRIDLR